MQLWERIAALTPSAYVAVKYIDDEITKRCEGPKPQFMKTALKQMRSKVNAKYDMSRLWSNSARVKHFISMQKKHATKSAADKWLDFMLPPSHSKELRQELRKDLKVILEQEQVHKGKSSKRQLKREKRNARLQAQAEASKLENDDDSSASENEDDEEVEIAEEPLKKKVATAPNSKNLKQLKEALKKTTSERKEDEEVAWDSALRKTAGEKVRDDPKLLKKSIRHLEAKKKRQARDKELREVSAGLNKVKAFKKR